jgi:hypothetical protein
MASLAQRQEASLADLRAIVESARAKTQAATTALHDLVGGFARSSSTVTATMGDTELGLKVTVGSLQKLERILKKIHL